MMRRFARAGSTETDNRGIHPWKATEMRRSTLQRKDRGELNQIAAALGAKPSSRARKDEIIQLIIDLTADGGPDPLPPADPGRTVRVRGGLVQGGNPRVGADGGPPDRPPEGAEGHQRRQTARTRPPTTATTVAPPTGPTTRSSRANRRRRRRNRDRDRDRDDNWDGDPVTVSGRLDLRDEGLRLPAGGRLPAEPQRRLRPQSRPSGSTACAAATTLSGTSRPANRAEKNPALLTLDSINGGPPELTDRPLFDDLTPIHALRRLTLEQLEDPEAITRPGSLIWSRRWA